MADNIGALCLPNGRLVNAGTLSSRGPYTPFLQQLKL